MCEQKLAEVQKPLVHALSVPAGWSFYAADFSINAKDALRNGSVMFVRDALNLKAWHALPDCIKESENAPPLYIVGYGKTLASAFADAYLRAEVVPVLLQDTQK